MPKAKTTLTKDKTKCCGGHIPHCLIYCVIILAILLGGAKLALFQYNYSTSIDDDTLQAVFLSNGQVYFGQLGAMGRGVYKLRNVYYLQVTQGLQQQEGEEKKEEAETNFSLVKLGDELHQPTSNMYINKDQILFWENLEADSPIIETIVNGQE
ncbi:MAG: hypothetical protein ABID45_00185 [Patescibacteria group bacterium]